MIALGATLMVLAVLVFGISLMGEKVDLDPTVRLYCMSIFAVGMAMISIFVEPETVTPSEYLQGYEEGFVDGLEYRREEPGG